MASDESDFAAEAVPQAGFSEPLRALLRWPAERFLAERDRWPLWLPVLMGAGVGVYFSLASEPPQWLGAALLALAVALGVSAWRNGRGLVLPAALVAAA